MLSGEPAQTTVIFVFVITFCDFVEGFAGGGISNESAH